MADVQPENGVINVARDLFIAIAQTDMKGLERRVLDAVIYLTYGINQTKAQMTVEDIRYILGASKKLRTDRISASLDNLIERKLIFKQQLVNGNFLLGIQKDYEEWLSDDKLSPLSITSNTNTINKTCISGDKMSTLATPEKLVRYAMSRSGIKHSLGSYKSELKQAKRLYSRAILETKNGPDAYQLIVDYIEQDEWMRENVKMQFTFMSRWFDKWFQQIPVKPKWIREDEELLGTPYWYNVKFKQWEPRP